MSTVPDELVEKAAAIIYDSARPPDHWDDVAPAWRRTYYAAAIAVLEAVGLPALLERVEAADQTMREAAREMDSATEELRFQRRRLDTALIERAAFEAERDALATKVADAGPAALIEAAGALRNDWVENGRHQGLPGCYSSGYEAWLRKRAGDLRAALDGAERS